MGTAAGEATTDEEPSSSLSLGHEQQPRKLTLQPSRSEESVVTVVELPAQRASR